METISFFVDSQHLMCPTPGLTREKFMENLPPLYNSNIMKIIFMEKSVEKAGYNIKVEIHRLMEGNQYLLF